MTICLSLQYQQYQQLLLILLIIMFLNHQHHLALSTTTISKTPTFPTTFITGLIGSLTVSPTTSSATTSTSTSTSTAPTLTFTSSASASAFSFERDGNPTLPRDRFLLVHIGLIPYTTTLTDFLHCSFQTVQFSGGELYI